MPFRGAILFVHPFADEMNKSRRAVAVATRRLAESGWSVLQIDLDGCGDSSGDLADARWRNWHEDVCVAAEWLKARGVPLKILWGLRLGALLAASVAHRLTQEPDLLCWQPVLSGKSHLTQFLRLKAVEQMLSEGGEKGITARLRADLAGGTAVEVAGYTLNPELASAIDAAEFTVSDRYQAQIFWLETGRANAGEFGPASAQRIRALVAAGHRVTTRMIAGASFWQTVEIEECPALLEATIDALDAAPRFTARE